MKFFLVAFALFVAATNAATYEDLVKKEWDLYKAEYGKSYANSAEDAFRMRVFIENKMKIAEHNLRYKAGEVTYEMGVNQFTDMFSEEVDDLYNGYNRQNRMRALPGEEPYLPELKGEKFVATHSKVPESVNWVDEGAVTPVRDQKACGSCYAFASLAALESRLILTKNQSDILSVQHALDCSWKNGNMGCIGGLVQRVFDFVLDNDGINSEASYPYEAREGNCRHEQKERAGKLFGYFRTTPGDEEELKKAVATGPVSVSVDASSPSFKAYKGGIYKDDKCSSTLLNHAILTVGYGTDPETKEDYWLVKNSWGTTWGENGFGKIARNANNMCGIATRALYPVV